MNDHAQTNEKIGIALGSGAARGWAHIGVLNALSEMGIAPDIVAGSSVGALVGAAYASEKLDVLEDWCRSLTHKRMLGYLDLSLLGGGLIQGEKLQTFVSDKIGDQEIDALPRVFAAVATDLETGQEVWLQEGSVRSGVQASMAIPGLFAPVRRNDQWLVDGGLTNPVPVSLCRALGATTVIAVNLNSDIVGKHSRERSDRAAGAGAREKGVLGAGLEQLRLGLLGHKQRILERLLGENSSAPGVFEVMAGSINIMQDRITRARMAGDPPEIAIAPQLAHLGLLEFDKAAQAIEEGAACANSMREKIEQALG
ncbi:MAG: patatin-like phospholipase RssA [Alphaproteobacteria bacterium]|nr:patatin-like phospholipase RssA [Alphaproteobacteria bacterium]